MDFANHVEIARIVKSSHAAAAAFVRTKSLQIVNGNYDRLGDIRTNDGSNTSFWGTYKTK